MIRIFNTAIHVVCRVDFFLLRTSAGSKVTGGRKGGLKAVIFSVSFTGPIYNIIVITHIPKACTNGSIELNSPRQCT